MRGKALALPALALALVGLTACPEKPSEAECEEFAEHFLKLVLESKAKDVATDSMSEDEKDKLVESCVKEGTKKEVECAMSSESMDDLLENCK